MQPRENVTLKRDTDAVLVPDGTEIVLSEGTNFVITQALGDTFTGITDRGAMVRISGRDADSLGKEIPESAVAPTGSPAESKEALEALVWSRLATCYDPEIPVNIVELGLIYSVEIAKRDDDTWKVGIAMTLTAPGCGMGEVLQIDAERKVRELPGVEEATVGIVFDPPWSMEMMSEVARLELGMS
ncbi:MAG: putative FeS assembly SUF system protein SufT [Hyphomicrobiaceae bacterium]|jgi:probable FeS assembly SUF system protein SufT